jgi:hypothetical protein
MPSKHNLPRLKLLHVLLTHEQDWMLLSRQMQQGTAGPTADTGANMTRFKCALWMALTLSTMTAHANPACQLWAGNSTVSTFSLKNFRAVTEICSAVPADTSRASTFVVIRKFTLQDSPTTGFNLAVDPATSQTSLISDSCLACHSATEDELSTMAFYQHLTDATRAPFPGHNDGLTHSRVPLDGAILTVDMCPATARGFESSFFTSLVERARIKKYPTPIGISITATWAKSHTEQFNWLKQQSLAGSLDITWVNHSYSHPYKRGIPEDQTFLLGKNVDFPMEIMANEKYLIEHGEIPSVFFRFPGLVSNETLVQKLKTYFLIPLGADAWLALGQKAKPGSIILVHGNLNEPAGIHLFDLLSRIQWPTMNLYSLYQGL